MHFMRTPLARRLLALCAGLVFSQAAIAGPMLGGAHEGFNYPDGTELTVTNNLAGGVGWNATGDSSLPNSATSRWADATALPAAGGTGPAKKVLYPTLSYTAIGYPISQGGKATIDASLANATNNVSRNFQQLVDTGTFYFSYLADKNNDTQRTTSLGFFGPANGVSGTPGNTPERFTFGQIGTGTAGNVNSQGAFALLFNNTNPANVVQAANPIAYGVDIAHLIVGRVDWNPTGNETVTMWVDPLNVSSEAAAGAPYIITNAFELTSINSIRLFSGNQAAAVGTDPIKPAVSADYDEIRVGGTWDGAIKTTAPVPEPATILLPIAGLAAFAARRRRV
jgi:hypothetical protein